MTSAIDNVELTRVGPGTVMGELMRQQIDPRGGVIVSSLRVAACLQQA